jgi:hypothetical protein
MLGHILWFSCLTLLFVICVDLLILHANGRTPPRLSLSLTFSLIGAYGMSLLFWALQFIRRFRR